MISSYSSSRKYTGGRARQCSLVEAIRSLAGYVATIEIGRAKGRFCRRGEFMGLFDLVKRRNKGESISAT